jgi:hypothetical protein
MQVLSKMLKVPITVYNSVTEQGGRGGGFTALGRCGKHCALPSMFSNGVSYASCQFAALVTSICWHVHQMTDELCRYGDEYSKEREEVALLHTGKSVFWAIAWQFDLE